MSNTENLDKKSVEEIEEALRRQEKILNNKKLISTLKDKGSKIKETIKKLKEELEHRKEVDELTLALSKLSSNDKPADLDSDDDDDPATPASKGQTTNVENIESDGLELNQETFCKQRSEKLQDGTAVAANPFRLNMTKSGRPVAMKSTWTKPPSDNDPELSALSPVFSETPAQLLSLTESMCIQKVQKKRLKEVAKNRDVERICERFGTTVENCPPEMVQNFLFANKKTDSEEEESDLSDDDDDNDDDDEIGSDTEDLVQNLEKIINEVL